MSLSNTELRKLIELCPAAEAAGLNVFTLPGWQDMPEHVQALFDDAERTGMLTADELAERRRMLEWRIGVVSFEDIEESWFDSAQFKREWGDKLEAGVNHILARQSLRRSGGQLTAMPIKPRELEVLKRAIPEFRNATCETLSLILRAVLTDKPWMQLSTDRTTFDRARHSLARWKAAGVFERLSQIVSDLPLTAHRRRELEALCRKAS